MLRHLLGMGCYSHHCRDPNPVQHGLFGKFTQCAFAPKHHFASSGHLGFEIRGSCTQLDALGSRHKREGFTHLDIEVGQNIAGQDDTRAVSNLRNFKNAVHTPVITEVSLGNKGRQIRHSSQGNVMIRSISLPWRYAQLNLLMESRMWSTLTLE